MRGYQWSRKRGGYNSIEEVAGFHVQLDEGVKETDASKMIVKF